MRQAKERFRPRQRGLQMLNRVIVPPFLNSMKSECYIVQNSKQVISVNSRSGFHTFLQE